MRKAALVPFLAYLAMLLWACGGGNSSQNGSGTSTGGGDAGMSDGGAGGSDAGDAGMSDGDAGGSDAGMSDGGAGGSDAGTSDGGGDASQSFTVGGTVTGLATGDSVVLQDNGGDNLTVSTDGAFTFATPVASGATFDVTVLTEPGAPAQTCTVSAGTGTVVAGNVTSVTVNCSTNDYTIGGTVTGLAGTVVLQDNGVDNLSLTMNGTFAFASPIGSGMSYAVTVLTNPASPSQSCVVTSGAGNVTNANVTSVVVTCTTTACPAETTGDCVLTTTNSGSTGTGTCAAGYTGSCSYSCSLATWTQVTDTCALPGSTAAAAGASCQALLAGGVTGSGVYWINPGGGGSQNAFQAYCNQVDAGGGWTLILHTWDSGTYPPTSAFTQNYAAWQTSGIGSASGYTGSTSSTFYVMPLAPMQTLISATAASLRFQSDDDVALATLTGLTMNASYGFGGNNTASVASTLCGAQAASNCFLLAPGFSSYDVSNVGASYCTGYIGTYYANVGYWYDDCYSTNVFATGGTYGGPTYYSDFSGDSSTSHWTWWVR